MAEYTQEDLQKILKEAGSTFLPTTLFDRLCVQALDCLKEYGFSEQDAGKHAERIAAQVVIESVTNEVRQTMTEYNHERSK